MAQDYRVAKAAITAAEAIWPSNSAVSDDEFPFSRSSVRSFRRGEVIAGAGVLVDMFARVQRGLVSASTMLSDGREFIVEIIPKAGLIGELEVLRGQMLDFEYRASSDCELHFFKGRLLRERCASDPAFSGESFFQDVGACFGARTPHHCKRRVVLAVQVGQHAFAALHGLRERFSE